jgi:hypothetical protein
MCACVCVFAFKKTDGEGVSVEERKRGVTGRKKEMAKG